MTETAETGMSFADFMEHSESLLTKWSRSIEDAGLILPLLSASHVFTMGDDDQLYQNLREVADSLPEALADRVPVPFSDLSLVTRMDFGTKGKLWTLQRVIENPTWAIPDPDAIQTFAIIGLREHDEPVMWIAYYLGGKPAGTMKVRVRVVEPIDAKAAREESGSIFCAIAAISHPLNYVVEVLPRLNPREERRVAEQRLARPARKRKHFIVVDHDVLVRMRAGTLEGGPSPAPHHRRGHWRRLAEQCVHLRALGKTKTWVRPALIGDPAFADQRNLYRVLLDFPRPPEHLG